MSNIQEFGITKDGQRVDQIHLTNPNQTLQATIITYGAALQSLLVPDSTSNLVDVVLGFDTVAEYEANPPYLGVVVGRVAGRISKATFCLPGNKKCDVTNTHGNLCLHGGTKGLSRQVWKVAEASASQVTLEYVSPDGEEGFPGHLTVRITYEVTPDNSLALTYRASCTEVCPLNLTNHAYFNLSGAGSPDIYDHTATIQATKTVELDSGLLPTGVVVPVDSDRLLTSPTLLDHSKVNSVGFEPCGFDLYYIFDQPDAQLARCRVSHAKSGRVIEMFTDQPGVQFYTSNFLDGIRGKGARPYPKHSAFCLEAQNWPDAANHDTFPDINLHPGQEYSQTTRYKFSAIHD